jgi:hypothetical protein
MLRGDVIGLIPVLPQVIKLEHLIVQRVGIGRAEGFPGRTIDFGAQQPSMVVKRPLAHHLEVLGCVPRWRLGIFGIEGVGEARPLDRSLLDAVNILR